MNSLRKEAKQYPNTHVVERVYLNQATATKKNSIWNLFKNQYATRVAKCQGDVWGTLMDVDLGHAHFNNMEGVYIIWQANGPVVRVDKVLFETVNNTS